MLLDADQSIKDRLRARSERPYRRVFDWISEPRPENLEITPFQQFTLDVDWDHSPLGPMRQWNPQLRHMVLLVMADPLPAVVFWGEENTIVYNEPYTQLIGDKHPSLQGQDPKIGFVEIWDYFEPLLANQRENAITVQNDDAFLLLYRYGFFEETFFSWKFVPIIGEEGWVVGSHATVVEATQKVLTNRRIAAIQEVSKQLATAKTVKDLWAGIIRGVEGAEKDVPMALVYSVEAIKAGSPQVASSPEDSMSPTVQNPSDPTSSPIWILEGSVGMPMGHGFAPSVLDITTNDCPLSRCFRKAMQDMTPVVMNIDEKAEKAMDGVSWRGYGVPSKTIVIYPIIPTQSGNVLAFLVLGLNPHRPYDYDYQQFVGLLAQQVTTPQLAAVLLRTEVERRQDISRQDAIDRDRLTRELSESETKFGNVVRRSPVGLAILTVDGLALFANKLWQDLTMLPIGSGKLNWEDVLVEGELEPVLSAWSRLITEKKPITIQTKVKRPWRAPEVDTSAEGQFETSLLLGLHPDLNEQGNVHTVMSVVTDISSLKWSEYQLRRRMDQAIEMKNQQERFIDMTSHEVRNPISAVIGCADEIITDLREYRKMASLQAKELGHTRLLDEAVEAAETIIYCALHQKRIIDDILTLSRLDSNLLIVAPEPSQLIKLVKNTIKMFEAELRRAETKLEFVEQDSLKELHVHWTLLDASRVTQVLLNLMTNAIKFTRTQKNRHIKVTIGASIRRPSEINEFGVKYVQKSQNSADQTVNKEWGDGEVLYISITVEDTGRGLDEAEVKNLFHLFQQASPKTHVQYGGSGLGLFISRLLVEMQGGEIGVASTANVGSTFQFYIKTRRISPPAESPEGNDYQLHVRDDALREACAVEVSTLPEAHPKEVNAVVAVSEITPQMRSLSTLSSLPSPPVDPKIFHILVVEDNLVNQKVVSKQLRKSGHNVSVANHGEEALDFLRHSEFWTGIEDGVGERLSVVLMDLEMPVMDGITCVKRIREWEREGIVRAHVPIIAVTANARRDQILRTMAAGMDDVTTKPYRIRDMLLQIEKVVSRYPESHTQENSPAVPGASF